MALCFLPDPQTFDPWVPNRFAMTSKQRLILLLLIPALGCGERVIRDSDALDVALEAAESGDVIHVGEGTFYGSFVVPAGVQVWGIGGSSRVIAPPDGVAFTLSPATNGDLTGLSNLLVESPSGCAGVASSGPGSIFLSGVEVRAATGVAIAIEGARDLNLTTVRVQGPITPDAADSSAPPSPPFRCGSGAPATHGIVLVDVTNSTFHALTVEGFTRFGLLSVRSNAQAYDTTARNNMGVGIEIWGGSASFSGDTSIEGTHHGGSALESYGLLSGGGATVSTEGASVSENEGYGIFHEEIGARHVDLTVSDNGGGIWGQHMGSFTIRGTSTIERNAFSGVTLIDSMNASINDATIADTVSGATLSGTVNAADGVQVSASQFALSNVSLSNNARVGAVFDLGGATTADIALTSVTVDADGASLGAIVQDGTALPSWDDDVVRLGRTATNDAAFTGTLEIASAVDAPCLPPLDTVEPRGIANLISP